jgi:F0F1-type ATP synthase membrane subunit a
MSVIVGGLVGFDLFIMLLRPITLILRILINVRLGHTVIEIFSVTINNIVVLILAIEAFVYGVQSYVFVILVKSYCDSY